MRALLIFLLTAATIAGPLSAPRPVAHKRAHLARCVRELRKADVSHLTDAQRKKRAAALKELERYAARGVFPVNTHFPGWEVPYLIDDYGTRCALAHLLDRTGHEALLQKLAKKDNHLYVNEIPDHRELGAWLQAHGLSLQEVAFIQGPGFNGDDPPAEEEPEPEPEPAPPAPPDHEVPEQAREPDVNPTGTPRDMSSLTWRNRRKSNGAGDWERWWHFNRAAYVNLRTHVPAARRMMFAVRRQARNRPTYHELKRILMPTVEELAGRKSKVRATALMTRARLVDYADAGRVVRDLVAYVNDGKLQYRDLMILAIGITGHEDGIEALQKVLHGDGPEKTRAHAAIALGSLGWLDAIEDLQKVVATDPTRDADLKAACVVSLGVLAQHGNEEEKREVAGFLGEALNDAKLPKQALAAIPMALARAGDLRPQRDIVRHFRGPTEVRQSCALALGVSAPVLDAELTESLEAMAIRDTDATVRRFAALALGEIGGRHRAQPESAERAARFFIGALRGKHRQAADRPWQYIGAALFARKHKEYTEEFVERLVRAAKRDKSIDVRAAAVVALGLMRDKSAVPGLATLFEKTKDVRLRGYVGETLALLDVRAHKDELVKMLPNDPNHAARALAYMGEIAPLVAELKKHPTHALVGSLADAGEKAQLDALLELVRTGDLWTRRRALAAISGIGRRADTHWNAEFRRGCNYTAITPTLATVLGLL